MYSQPHNLSGPVLSEKPFNPYLDFETSLLNLNEDFLAQQFEILMAAPPKSEDLYALYLARLSELALYCAGRYADGGEIPAAGNLLINPRQVLVHIRGQRSPVLKERHTPMTEQFRSFARGRDIKIWLKENVKLETVRLPLLPHLMELMNAGGRLAPDYLDSVDQRTRRVSETINLVMSCLAWRDIDFFHYLAGCRAEDREFIEKGLCSFDLKVFREIGLVIRHMEKNLSRGGRFLKGNSVEVSREILTQV